MQRLRTLLIALSLATLAAGCSHDPGTSLKIALAYDDALGLDTADVTLSDRTESGRIAHQLLLLVPDELAGMDMMIEVWGRKAGKRAAYGTATAVPRRGHTVAASVTLTACTPSCTGAMLTSCTGPMVSCALGCSEDGDAHCFGPRPSNGVDPTAADPLRGTTTISANATFDTDTGAIIGGLDRPAGTGIAAGVGYVQAPASGPGGAPLGIFVFHNLTVEAGATVRFTGARAAVLLVGDAARIAGVINAAAGHPTPGPGGGAGGSEVGPARGCGAGAPGVKSANRDSGGGGGGAGSTGGPGGDIGGTLGGLGGAACMPALLEPLQGGSGGGRGSPGGAASAAAGGSGGGALQITALGSLEITGTINAGGAGGEAAAGSSTDAGGGGGGGSGGAILLEAPTVITGATAIVVANGGGGGGGGGTIAGGPGDDGGTSTQPAQGGFGGELSANGGTGGSLGSPPDVGTGGATNGGGGGGAAGVIAIRGRTLMIAGTISPHATQADVQR
ncbi:MAG: hypothetical protein E6J90_38010 [Deltaproteobacteria bacterium]|nr:MAG: hypothetical protein E6J90_38010 [Deltaproteobacteria bacterium]